MPDDAVVAEDAPYPAVKAEANGTRRARVELTSRATRVPTGGPHRGHIRATNDRIAADNNGH
jgi:hypothetical protein